MSDVRVKIEDTYFSYCVGAVIIHENNVLMVKNNNYPYFYSVGGAVQIGETSESALLREVYEETGIRLDIDRLAFIHENLFVADFMGNTPLHELRLFYLMKVNEEIAKIVCNSTGIDGGKETLHWLPLDGLSDYRIYPEFFKTELKHLADEVLHFVTENGATARI